MKIVTFILALLLLTGCQGYRIENGKWSLIRYNEGVGRLVTVVEGADTASFTPLNRDVDSFRVTGTIEARDKHKKYRGDRVDWLK